MKKHKNSAFTLIELSLVLVIIGLLIGGVMVGRDLIEFAKVRAQITQLSDIETQINTFRVKYGCLPGDCAYATDILGSGTVNSYSYGDCNSSVCNGTGNGIIQSGFDYAGVPVADGECLNPSASGEISQLFLQLSLAGLGDYGKGSPTVSWGIVGREYPYAKYRNGTGVYVTCLTSIGGGRATITPGFARSGNTIMVGASGGGTASRLFYSLGYNSSYDYTGWGYGSSSATPLFPFGIPADAARKIDEKMDDGKPSSGKFGIVTGSSALCDNTMPSRTGAALLAAYPSPELKCDVVAGKALGSK
jgi:prepilin-type N-terminal cleavage/methylation domain-containing protein